MASRLETGATRALSRGEQVLVLRNQVAFLEEQIVEMLRRIDLLVDDNAEMDYLAGLNERARSPEMVDLYGANVARIEDLRGQVAAANDDIAIYRRVLAERFGIEA
ncbi:MAG TPA: hypothetical protein VHF22_00610 [Planctomycetota bacterium]|nr:hypothetical protein [Planctomycetota bacterium]